MTVINEQLYALNERLNALERLREFVDRSNAKGDIHIPGATTRETFEALLRDLWEDED